MRFFSKPRILSIGGGTGLSTLLRGLKNGPAALSVIVTVTDDGGSSGRLREDLGVMPPGDIRNCMIALSEDENLMARLFRFRFAGKGELHNHSFGNLFLSAMAGVTRDFAEAVRLTSEVLAIKGVIYPSTNSDVTLEAEFADGSSARGETRITASRKKIRQIVLKPPTAQPLDAALNAIAKADLISMGPGSLYTSLIPNLLVDKIVDAVERSAAKKIYIQNIMTQPGESDDMSAADHVEALVCHSRGKLLFSRILLNNAIPSPSMLRKYELEGARLVKNDKERLLGMGLECVECDLLAKGRVIRHDPDKLARALYSMLGV
ncbi:MAG TPA: gluconeogenesis factor YvcK family protein [Terriglobia bacterium]|nr:gluconeogenesis factor YvcK family protein [Terriglobia bacterium]